MGERRARWGYGYQDKIATERTLNLLRESIREGSTFFEGIRLADLYAGRVDDFVIVWGSKVEGNSIKWSGEATPLNWGDLIGVNGLIKELADGYHSLKDRWPSKAVSVRLQSNRPPSYEKHHAQLITSFSVAEFLRDHWLSGPTDHDPVEVNSVWSRISLHLGLNGVEFLEFVKACSFFLGYPEPPGSGLDSQDWRHYVKQFKDLHKAIATWLTNNPNSDFIDRDILLSAIGFRSYHSGLIQRFPNPKIPYSKNETSAVKLKKLIETTNGGYLAVVGPAGIGKSTLVQDVLSDTQQYPYFIPYYAFLPEIDGNRERGEALTFFQDVIERLDKYFPGRYSLGISDVSQARDAIREHMSRANNQYVIQGYKTILLIDGLDHVSREINLQSTLLHELPSPDEIPDGFLIILSSQPQALIPGIIMTSVGNAVASQTNRRIVVSGLTRPEVHAILEKVDKTTTSLERDALFNASLGNPLIITYLLKLFEERPETTAQEAINLAGNYTGDIQEYYESILSIHLQEAKERHLLGLLCRAAPTIPVIWLQDWPERIQFENILHHTLAPFIQVENGELKFIHNSLIAFLKSETRSKIPGADLAADERKFHSILADRCGDRSCANPLGRAKVYHLLHAGRIEELLRLLASKPSDASSNTDWLRQAIGEFLPYDLIRPYLLYGLNAAWELQDIGQVIRLVLLGYELGQRTSRIEAGDLAEKLLSLDKPELAISQIRAVGRLLVEDRITLEFAYSLWFYADDHNRLDLKQIARELYLQAKPASFFFQHEPIDTKEHHDYSRLLRSWSSVAPFFEDPKSIVAQIVRLHFKFNQHGEEVDEADIKASLLYEVLNSMLNIDARMDECQILSEEINRLGKAFWRFGSLLNLAMIDQLYVSFEDLKIAYYEAERDNDIDLAYAEFLFKYGYCSEAKDIVMHLTHIRFDGIRNNHSFGFSDISYTVKLRCLQELLGLPEGIVPSIKDDYEEAVARVESAAKQLGILLAVAKKGELIPNLDMSLRSLLLFHNRPVKFDEFDWRNKYIVIQSKPEIYQQLMRVTALIGKKGAELLKDILLELINGPAAYQFTDLHRRYFAKELYRYGVLSKKEAVELGLSLTKDTLDDDPMQRQEACFDIAIFLHLLSEDILSEQWFKRAGEVTAGAGGHKDYHMSFLADWLSRSVGDTLTTEKLKLIEKYARAVEVAGGDGATDAIMNELKMIIQIAPHNASDFAVELIDRDVLNVSQIIRSLILGASKAEASPNLLFAIYSELLLLIDPESSPEEAVAVLRRFPSAQRTIFAKTMIDRIRTNSLSSRRIEIARAFQDELRHDGLGEYNFTEGLKPGEYDSSKKHSLYMCSTGETETIDQVAVRLSNYETPEIWNPNPANNAEFDWWSAVKKAKIKNISHLNDLLSSFPPPNYREVELLAWKSEHILESGDRNSAKLLAEEAIARAKDASWFNWIDGAQKKTAYNALKRINSSDSLSRARTDFGKDLSSGKLSGFYLLSDILELMDFLEIDWPNDEVCNAIDDYLNQVLAANKAVPFYTALNQSAEKGSADEAICRFLIYLLAFPVIDVGIAARKALSQYAGTDTKGILAMLIDESCYDSVQLEHILISLHVSSNNFVVNSLHDWILNLNKHESIAVRCIARRICEEQGWRWEQLNNEAKQPVIILSESLSTPKDYKEARKLVGGDIATAILLYPLLFAMLEDSGVDPDELRSEFYSLYREIEKNYHWKDDNRLKLWMKMVCAKHWLHPRAIIGREAAMRILGRRSLSGQAPANVEQSYDYLYPIYDPKLELSQPVERPIEMTAMDWELLDDRKEAWRRGDKADSWTEYPETLDGLYIIGERTWFIRPEWEWPREERYRGLIIGPHGADESRKCLETSHALTIESYLRGYGQNNKQLIVLNSERELVGPAYRWAAINSTFARRLGWHPVKDEPFKWVNSSGHLMVKSVYWKDGWIWIEPPRFESLGEGWLVLANEEGISSIHQALNNIELHLWVERYSFSENPYEGKWHLYKSL